MKGDRNDREQHQPREPGLLRLESREERRDPGKAPGRGDARHCDSQFEAGVEARRTGQAIGASTDQQSAEPEPREKTR